MKSRAATTGLLLLILMFLAVKASSQTLHYSGSAQYSVGDYIFTERTTSWYFANELGVSHRRISARVTVPLVRQSSPWISYTTMGGLSTGGPAQGEVRGRDDQQDGKGRGRGEPIAVADTTEFTTTALSDPSMVVTYSMLEDLFGGRSLRVRASAKAPLASPDDGFGTGAWDYSVGASAMRRRGTLVYFADLSYWIPGDMEELQLKNSFAYALSIARSLRAGSYTLLGSISGNTVIVSGTQPSVLIGAGVGHSFQSGNGINASVAIGLTESTPRLSVGLGWRIGLKRW